MEWPSHWMYPNLRQWITIEDLHRPKCLDGPWWSSTSSARARTGGWRTFRNPSRDSSVCVCQQSHGKEVGAITNDNHPPVREGAAPRMPRLDARVPRTPRTPPRMARSDFSRSRRSFSSLRSASCFSFSIIRSSCCARRICSSASRFLRSFCSCCSCWNNSSSCRWRWIKTTLNERKTLPPQHPPTAHRK